jgi:hypothetical protein
MVARWFARWGGALMIVFAVVAFLYPGSSVGLSPINLDVSYGYFSSLFENFEFKILVGDFAIPLAPISVVAAARLTVQNSFYRTSILTVLFKSNFNFAG